MTRKHFGKIVYCLFIITSLLTVKAYATVYYVDINDAKSSDYNVGTEMNPFKTIKKGIDIAKTGDTVYIRSGNYYVQGTGQRYIPALNPTNSGSIGYPITIGAYPGDHVTISLSSGGGPVLGAYKKQYIVWKNLIVIEGETFLTDCGIVSLWSSDNCVIDGLEIIGKDRNQMDNHNGIRLENVNAITVRNCKIHGVTNNSNNKAHNNSGITMYRAINTIIENNEIYNCTNLIYDKCWGTNNTIRFNYLHSAPRGILTYGGCSNVPVNSGDRIYQNVFKDLFVAGIDLRIYVEDIQIYNNTFYNCSGSSDYAVVTSTSTTGVSGFQIWNNIFSASTRPYHFWKTDLNHLFYSDHNCFHYATPFLIAWSVVGSGSLNDWKNDNRFDLNSFSSDPGFVNAAGNSVDSYKLVSNSPCKDKGRNGETIGAYITGNEIIGLDKDQILKELNPPENLRIMGWFPTL